MGPGTGTKPGASERAAQAQDRRKRGARRARRESSAARYVILFCELALLVAVGWQVYRHVAEIRPMITAPFQFDYEEGNILNALVRVSHGLTPYPDPHGFPNVLNPYGPVAYYLLAVPVKLFGVTFAGPRLVIALSVLAICVFIALMLARMTRSPLLGAVFGFLYGGLGLVRDWSAILRVDLLVLALATAGMFFFSRTAAAQVEEEDAAGKEKDATRKPRRASVITSVSAWAAAVLMSAAIFAKHTSLAAPAACVLFLLLHRRSRQALYFALMGFGLCVLGLAASVALTRGTIITDLFFSHPDPFAWSGYTDRLAEAAWRFAPLLALALVAVVEQMVRKKPSLPALWLMLATLTAVTAGKLGSNWNHFLEWPIALCLCAGLGWAFLTRLEPRPWAATLAVAAAVGVGFMVMTQRPSKNQFAAVRECPAAYEFVRSQAGDRILSENVGALVLGGKKVWVSNLFVYNQLIEHAGWQDVGMKKMIEARGFDLIVASRNYAGNKAYSILGVDRFSPEDIQAIVGNYDLAASFDCRDAAYMFEPKQ